MAKPVFQERNIKKNKYFQNITYGLVKFNAKCPNARGRVAKPESLVQSGQTRGAGRADFYGRGVY